MGISKLWLLVLALMLTAAIGCSGGQVITPTPTAQDLSDEFPTVSDSGSSEINSGLLGLYQITLDSDALTSSVETVRSAAAMDVFEAVDITGFMTASPCFDCAKIFGVSLDTDNNLVMRLGVKHPFPVGDPSKAITGKNRADLQVFNVEGTIITDGPKIITFPGAYKDIATGYLMNPDGYSTYYDFLLDYIIPTTSDAHPYILHFDDYSTGNYAASNENGFADPLHPTGNLVMAMGSDYSIKDYKFAIPENGSLSFMFAIGCTFGMSTQIFLDRFDPVYRVPQHNKKAASEVHVDVLGSTLEINEPTSSATLRIEVMDINAGAEVGEELDKMLYASNVGSITVEIPGICETTFDNPVPLSGDGRTAPLVFEVTVFNDLNDSGSGAQPCLVKVKDAYPARQNPNPALGKADGMGRGETWVLEPFQIIEFATYQYLTVNVESCEAVGLRAGVTAIDVGVDGLGRALIGYSDNQVWRYDYHYCEAEYLYTVDIYPDTDLLHVDGHEDGRSITLVSPCDT